jgi:hypothetical protein
MTPFAVVLAEWAHDLQPTADDFPLAGRSLLVAVAVTVAALPAPGSVLCASPPGRRVLGFVRKPGTSAF